MRAGAEFHQSAAPFLLINALSQQLGAAEYNSECKLALPQNYFFFWVQFICNHIKKDVMWLENIYNNCQRLLRFPHSKALQVPPCEVQDGTSGEMSVFPSITTDITQINSLCCNILLVHKFPSRTTRCQMIGCADWGGCWPGATEQVRTASPPPTYSSGCRLIAGNFTVATIQGGNLKLTHSEEPPTVIHINSASQSRKSSKERSSNKMCCSSYMS